MFVAKIKHQTILIYYRFRHIVLEVMVKIFKINGVTEITLIIVVHQQVLSKFLGPPGNYSKGDQ